MEIFLKVGNIGLNIIYFFIKLFPTRNKITLISRQGNESNLDFDLISKGINANLSDYKVIILVKKLSKLTYIMHIFKQMYHIATSKIVILDSYCIPISILKHKKELKVIQMWHALGLMKKAGYSILDKKEGRKAKVARIMKMHKNYDYIFASSDNCREALAEVFNYPKENVITMPLPRVDILRDRKYIENKKNQIINKYPKIKNKKNIVYAPTHRNDEDKLEEKIKELITAVDYENYNLVIKLHPLSNVCIYDSKVIIDNEFSTMEMLTISDYVIADYSAIIYEAGILKKPLYFYAFDYSEYNMNRGFFIKYDKEIPGKKYKTGKDVFQAIKEEKQNLESQEEFINKYVDLSRKNCTKDIINFIKK